MGGPIIQPRSFTLWVDADAAPREVKEIVFRVAARLGLQTVLVANQRLQLPPGAASKPARPVAVPIPPSKLTSAATRCSRIS